jgi:8-oxo-dGTP pyrophosphatase MutT (NUDIX family)
MDIEQEIAELARQYGEPGRATFEFTALSNGFGEWVTNLTRRRGEIVLVVPRAPGYVLLHTKSHYPENVYRLPTGGIHQGEAADDAARRESDEEIGFHPASLRLWGVLENVFFVQGKELVYPSFVFETEPFTAAPNPTDPEEAISGFMDADVMELQATAHYLASLPGQWREWGLFRAAAHRWLAARMQE